MDPVIGDVFKTVQVNVTPETGELRAIFVTVLEQMVCAVDVAVASGTGFTMIL